MNKNNQKGFTLLELLLVVGVTVLLAGASVPLYNKLYSGTELRESQALVSHLLNVAQQKSIVGLEDSQYGVFFEINPSVADKLIAYKGDSYDLRDANFDEIHLLSENISLSLGFDPADINFEKGSGLPDNFGMIEFAFISNDEVEELEVNKYGISN